MEVQGNVPVCRTTSAPDCAHIDWGSAGVFVLGGDAYFWTSFSGASWYNLLCMCVCFSFHRCVRELDSVLLASLVGGSLVPG